jgi:hypothetical protein
MLKGTQVVMSSREVHFKLKIWMYVYYYYGHFCVGTYARAIM